MSFARRRIDVTITLGEGQFGEQLGDTMTLTGYRVQAEITVAGGEAMGTAQLRIFGLPVETLNRLTTIGPIATSIRAKNTVSIAAGIDGQALTTVYSGTIFPGAWAEMQEAPNTALVIQCASGASAALKPVGASSYTGSADVAGIMADFAAEAGFAFENNGVHVTLDNPYFPGTTLDKIKACARAAGIFYSIENGTLAIWPNGGARQASQSIVVSPETGLVGYPSYNQQGIGIRTLFNPNFQLGRQFEISGSAMTPANRTWNCWWILHSLESQTPNGAWFTDVIGYAPASS